MKLICIRTDNELESLDKKIDNKTDRYQLIQKLNETLANQNATETILEKNSQMLQVLNDSSQEITNQLTNGQQRLEELDKLIDLLNRNLTVQDQLISNLTTEHDNQIQCLHNDSEIVEQQRSKIEDLNRTINNLTETISSVKSTVKNSTCYKPECLAASAALIESMNTTADPCNDFFQFACGGFLSRNPLPDQKYRQLSLDVLQDEVTNLIRGKMLCHNSVVIPDFQCS